MFSLDSSSVHMWMQHCSNCQTKQTLYVFLLYCHLFGVLCKDPVNISDLVSLQSNWKATHTYLTLLMPNLPRQCQWHDLSPHHLCTHWRAFPSLKNTQLYGRKRSERVCFSRSAAGQCVRHATHRPLYCCSISAGNNSCSVKLHGSQ